MSSEPKSGILAVMNLTAKQVAALQRTLRRKGLPPIAVGTCLRIAPRTEVCRDRNGFYKVGGLDRRARAEIRKGIPGRHRDKWVVHEGSPSWHQQQAGHVSAAQVIFYTEDEAYTHAQRLRSRGVPAMVIRQFGKPRPPGR